MGQQVYQELFEVMKNRRGPYTGVEVPEFYPMVEELFTPQEAEVNNVMPRKPVTSAIDKNETIGVGTCYCRQASKLVGEDTHADLKIRRSAPMPAQIVKKLDATLAQQEFLDWEAPISGAIKL